MDHVELRERRQAELDFVSAAYGPEEAWWSLLESEDGNLDEGSIDIIVARVHRRLDLKPAAASTSDSTTDSSLPIVLKLSMPAGYPCHVPLQVQASLLASSSPPPSLSSPSPTLIKAAYDALPKLTEACRQTALESVGEEAIFSVLSTAEQWLQDEWPQQLEHYASSLYSSRDAATPNGTTSTAITAPILLGRRLIYSHHIISKSKRADIQSLATQLHLTGYLKIGWPGLIIIEGREEDCVDFYDEIRPWSWQYLVVRGEQQEQVASIEQIENWRRFSSFQEVDDMSVVAQHCREVGLEALFKTSMKVYSDTATSNDNAGEGQQPTLTGALVLVDHMNDAKNYRKWLRKTASICDCQLLIKHSKVCSEGQRPSFILVALVDNVDGNAVSNMLKRWRTAKVDVDSRGKPCLERKMTVLVQGEVANDALGVVDWNEANSEEGLTVGAQQLQAMLAAIGGPIWQEALQAVLLLDS